MRYCINLTTRLHTNCPVICIYADQMIAVDQCLRAPLRGVRQPGTEGQQLTLERVYGMCVSTSAQLALARRRPYVLYVPFLAF